MFLLLQICFILMKFLERQTNKNSIDESDARLQQESPIRCISKISSLSKPEARTYSISTISNKLNLTAQNISYYR